VNLQVAALNDGGVKPVAQLQASMGSWVSYHSDEHNNIMLRNVPTRTETLL